jgi:nucleoside-diphosphate-sugar epimerase
MSVVMVTGGTGFIGQYCVDLLLDHGHEVHVLTRNLRSPCSSQARYYAADLMDTAAINRILERVRPRLLLHLAWFAVPEKYWTAPENLDWVQASLGLYRIFEKSGGGRMVTSGTCAEYDWHYSQCLESKTPCRPAALYGICKHALSEIAESFCALRDLSHAWARIFYVYGPNDYEERFIPCLIRAMLEGRPAACRNGNQALDFLYVRDVASALVRLLESDLQGPVNVGSGVPKRLGDISRHIATALGCPELLTVSEQTPADSPSLLFANIKRLREELGWSPKYSLEAGLDELISWLSLRSVPSVIGRIT